jgi:hypothetical protein
MLDNFIIQAIIVGPIIMHGIMVHVKSISLISLIIITNLMTICNFFIV